MQSIGFNLYHCCIALIICACSEGVISDNTSISLETKETSSPVLEAPKLDIKPLDLSGNFMYPYNSRSGFTYFLDGKPYNSSIDCCQGEFQYVDTRQVDMACSGDTPLRHLKIGTVPTRPTDLGFENHRIAPKSLIFEIDGQPLGIYSAMVGADKEGRKSERKAFSLTEFFSPLSRIDLLAYSCGENDVLLVVEADKLLLEGLSTPVAVDQGGLYSIYYVFETSSLRVTPLPPGRLDQAVKSGRTRIAEKLENDDVFDCPLNVWPCDHALREARIKKAMEEIVGYESDDVSFLESFEP